MKWLFVRKVSGFAWLVWGLVALFFLLQYMVRIMPGVAAASLMRGFSIDAFSLGTLSACFYYAYSVMQLPAGVLIDRFSVRYLLVSMVVVAGLGCLLFAVAHSLLLAELGRLLIGFGAAFSFIGAIKLANMWFPANWLGFITGLTETLGLFGAVLGAEPAAYMMAHTSWRVYLGLLAFLFFLLGFVMWFFVRKRKKNFLEQILFPEEETSLWRNIRIVLRKPQMWLNVLYASTIYGPTAAFGEFWGVTFIQRVYNVSTNTAAFAVSLIFIGWMVGSPLMGFLVDYVSSRRVLMFASALLSFIFLASVLYLPLSVFWLCICLFLYGLVNTGLVINYVLAVEISPRKAIGTSVALINMASILIGMLLQPAIGFLLDFFWKGVSLNKLHVYSIENFRLSMFVLIVCFVVAGFSAFWIKEARPRAVTD